MKRNVQQNQSGKCTMFQECKYTDSGCGEQSIQKEGAGAKCKAMTQEQKTMKCTMKI